MLIFNGQVARTTLKAYLISACCSTNTSSLEAFSLVQEKTLISI